MSGRINICIKCGSFVGEEKLLCKGCRECEKELFGTWHWEDCFSCL